MGAMDTYRSIAVEQTAPTSRTKMIALDMIAFVLLAAATGVATGIALAGITLLFAAPT